MSYRVQHIKIKDWFPPEDQVAVTIVRLCILRQDLLLECQAIRETSLPSLDQNGEEWRRLYFWRNSFRTLENIRGAVHALKSQKVFLTALKKEPNDVQKGFARLTKDLQKVSDQFLKNLRNELGGHILGKAVADALRRMEFDQTGLVQVSDGKVGQQQYKFVTELVYQMILSKSEVTDARKELKRRSRISAKLMWAVLVIDELFNTYIKARKLLR
ncbi:MAG: hypothetical protein MRJ68_14755 [Nitrospira sp.]|nr:hypothetical protein [Nitrospira sp.]